MSHNSWSQYSGFKRTVQRHTPFREIHPCTKTQNSLSLAVSFPARLGHNVMQTCRETAENRAVCKFKSAHRCVTEDSRCDTHEAIGPALIVEGAPMATPRSSHSGGPRRTVCQWRFRELVSCAELLAQSTELWFADHDTRLILNARRCNAEMASLLYSIAFSRHCTGMTSKCNQRKRSILLH